MEDNCTIAMPPTPAEEQSSRTIFVTTVRQRKRLSPSQTCSIEPNDFASLASQDRTANAPTELSSSSTVDGDSSHPKRLRLSKEALLAHESLGRSSKQSTSSDSIALPLSSISLSSVPSPSQHYRLHQNIVHLVQCWGDRMKHIHPNQYLQHLLTTRGYDNRYFEADECRRSTGGTSPSGKRIEDYDLAMVNAVRLSDLEALEQMCRDGKSMAACNRYSESVLHMACRRSSYETIRFMVDKVESIFLVDDFGRTPLHDACWRPEPQFAIAALLLDLNLDMIRCKDKRGATPLDYVRKEHWPLWCAFLDCQKDKYWAPRSPSASASSTQPSSTINSSVIPASIYHRPLEQSQSHSLSFPSSKLPTLVTSDTATRLVATSPATVDLCSKSESSADCDASIAIAVSMKRKRPLLGVESDCYEAVN